MDEFVLTRFGFDGAPALFGRGGQQGRGKFFVEREQMLHAFAVGVKRFGAVPL